tara:strand:- start:8421 stop:8843 length:423 start_codon:yes stop_codon:yes gene_type:complete
MNKLLFITLLSLFFTACANTTIANFSIVSTKNYQSEKEYKSIGRIQGEDIQYIIIFIPTGSPRIDKAVTNALINNNAEYITDVSVFNQVFYIPYIGGINKYVVTGEGWNSIQNEINKLNIDKDIIIKYNPETGERISPKQ